MFEVLKTSPKTFGHLTILSGIIVVLLMRYNSPHVTFQRWIPSFAKISTKRSVNHDHKEEIENHFRFHWRRERKPRTDWWGIVKPCFHNMDWGQVKPGWEKNQRSDASVSSIISQDIRPAGEYSRLFIETKTKDGRLKWFGGDSWRVYLRGPASIAATVLDHNNGTYEALFLVMEPGVYRIETHLDYSLCDGLRNPPPYWFIKGNSHGKYQKDGLLGLLDEYLNQQLPGNLTITIQPARHNVSIENILGPSPQCKEYCTFLYDGYGRWINGTWAPFLTTIHNTSTHNDTKVPTGTIISYGDSLALRFGNSMAGNQNVRKVYRRSTYRYNWIYPVGNEQNEKRKDDDLDFDIDRVVSYIEDALDDPSYNREDSALVLNIGLHCVMSVNFSSYQILLEKVLDLLFVNQSLANKDKLQPRYKATVIWKTTTQLKKENDDSPFNRTDGRFFTTQRVLLYNAYATWRMCRAGVPVVDVFPVTLSYLPGPTDTVHYPDHVFKQAEDALAHFKRFHNNKSHRLKRTCIS